MFSWGRGFHRDDTGAVAPLVALALIGLVAMGALAWDVSRAFALRGELDSAVDAAALAGATQLDLGSDAITRATSAAQGALVTNSQRLANTREASVAIANADIKFLSALTPTRTYTTVATSANFIEINLTPRNLGLVAGAMAWTGAFHVTAHAVAGYGAAICLVPPLMICNPAETGTVKTFDGDAYTGKAFMLTPPPGGNSVWGPGNFGFLDVGNGASAVKDAMGRIQPKTQCFGSTVVTEPGNVASADDWFNTRFDIYVGSAAGNKSDLEFAPALNTMIGAQTASGNSSCSPSVSVPPNSCADTNPVAAGYGFPRDCDQTGNFGTGQWNAGKYFATNHSGISLATFTPSAPTPAPYSGSGWNAYGPAPVAGATSPTRYQVYNWELAILSGAITKPPGAFSSSQDANPPSGTADFARPACNRTNLTQATPDRRVISAVVVNCAADNVHGQSTVHVISDLDLFLIGPAVSNVIYGEVIGASSAAVGNTLGKPTKKYWVRLYE